MLFDMKSTNDSLIQAGRKTTESAIRIDAVARRIEKVERQNRNLQAKCQEFNSRYGRQLALGALEPFSKAVIGYMAEESKPHSQLKGRPHTFTRHALGIPAGTIVLLTLQSVINGLSEERSLVSVADTIGTLLDEYCRDGEVWTGKARQLVGLKCIELLEKSVPDLIQTRRIPKPGQEGRKTEYHIFPTEKTLVIIETSAEKVGWAHPFFVPTLSIPDAYESTNASEMVSRVLNSIQATPWTINRRVYEVALAEKAGEKNMRAASTMLLAKEYLEADQFYFPAHLDFRGRIYASPTFLSFQSDDLGAALLTFPQSEGKRLGNDGLYWLRLHGTNLFGHGVDKVNLGGRQSWGLFFESGFDDTSVHDIADNPLKHDVWKGADKRWQFLAWCFEYSAALRHPEGPESFVSTLPVAIDGSCNGLQHLSAVMRDEVGGQLVNLVGIPEDEDIEAPDPDPADVYGAIANKIKSMMEQEQDPVKKAYADAWLKWPIGVSRKAAKQIVMVVPYAADRYGATDKLISDYLDVEPTCPWTKRNKRLMARYFTDLAFKAVAKLVPSSLLLRDWLKKVSDALSKANLPIEWRAPITGFAVLQENYKYKTKKVQPNYMGKRRSLSLRIDSNTDLSPRLQRNAITANFIHSLDAAHLVLTMSKLLNEGVSRFGCVHDSYVALAADMDLLFGLTRRAFIELHTGNLMEAFLEASSVGLPEDVKERLRGSMPKQRGLILEQVASSPYIFS
jgi:DNA-directed RNA polymerase